MPVLTQEQWANLDPFRRWLAASRAAVLSLTGYSVSVAGLLAFLRGDFDGIGWLLCMVGLLFAHATNNLINDYVDYSSGLDRDNYFRVRYGTHVLNDQLLTPESLRNYIIFTGGTGLLFGFFAVIYSGYEVLIPFSLGAFLLLFYTWPLKHWALGEVAVLLAWGPLMVAGTYQVMTSSWDWQIAWIGLWIGMPQTLVILAKHIDKLGFDAARGVHTLPVLLGHVRSRFLVVVTAIAVYMGLIALILLGDLPYSTIITLGSVPALFRLLVVFAHVAPEQCPADYPTNLWPLWYTTHAFQFFRIFSGLLLLGLILGLFLRV